MCRLWILAGALGAVLAGCSHTCTDNPDVRSNFEIAQLYYNNSKFDEAKGRYVAAVEACPDFYEGLVGLGNACREYGNQLFMGVQELSLQRKRDQAQKMLNDAVNNHKLAYQCFKTAIDMRPEDFLPRYGLGLFHYQRATSPIPYPFAHDDKEHRPQERDLAIEQFEEVVKRHRDAYNAHRYLGIALFTAGRVEEAREHLITYHDVMQRLWDKYLGAPSGNDDEKIQREEALKALEREIADAREVLIARRADAEARRKELVAKGDALKPEERQELARMSSELLILDNLMRRFALAKMSPAEKGLAERCHVYIQAFNRQSFPECLAFQVQRPGEEALLRRQLQERLGKGVKYENIQMRNVVVSGEAGTAGFLCDVVTREGRRPGAEVTLRWKMVAGQWLVAEHP